MKPNVLKKSKYADLIHDFGYFEKVDELEKMFNNDTVSCIRYERFILNKILKNFLEFKGIGRDLSR